MTNMYQAAEEAFGTHIVEPYIGMKMRVGNKYKIFNKTHELVYKAYKYDKDLLNDEMELLAWVWAHEGWDYDYGLQWNLKKVTHPETISRRRRELHEAGLITYSPKAMKSRETAFKNERDKASPIPPQVKVVINQHLDDNEWYMVSANYKPKIYKQTRLV